MQLTPRRFKTTIRLTVVAAFVLVTLLTTALATGLQYYFSESMAKRAAAELYEVTASGVAAELNGISRVYVNVIQLLAANSALATPEADQELLATFTGLLQNNPMLYGAYVGRDDGSFVEVINLESAQRANISLGEDTDDTWLQLTVDNTAGRTQRRYRYLDDSLRVTRTRAEDTDYSALDRDWYQLALGSADAYVSPPYLFAQSGKMGRTISRRVNGTEAVAALDITLVSLSEFLAEQQVDRHSRIYLFDATGSIIASNLRGINAGEGSTVAPEQALSNDDVTQLPDALLGIALEPSSHRQLVSTDIGGEEQLFYSAQISEDDNAVYLGIVTPTRAIMAPFREKILASTGLTLALLLLLIPLSWLFAHPIVRPIKQLAKENDKVRKLQFSQVKRIESHVLELDELSASMVNMVESIQAHEEAQRSLMDAVIKLIGQAIDDKSAYTGGHCERVPELALMLAEAAHSSTEDAFKAFSMDTENQWREYRIAAWLHDCGKITTPEHIVDKGSKLEAIYNRIHEVRMRFEVLSRDAELEYWRQLNQYPEKQAAIADALAAEQAQLQSDFAFVAQCNVGGEQLDDDRRQRLLEIAERTWQRCFDDELGLSPVEELRKKKGEKTLPVTEQLLANKPEHIIERERPPLYDAKLGINMEIPEHLYNQGELYNLEISRGTLTREDRFKINEHMISTIKMLEGLPFPEELKNVPRYASTHHETLKGTGYPRKLKGVELSIPERILAIADIFEALTASDRPYKKAKPVSVAIGIMYEMAQNEHIDRDCFELFLRSGVYKQYSSRYLEPEQLDTLDISNYLRAGAS